MNKFVYVFIVYHHHTVYIFILNQILEEYICQFFHRNINYSPERYFTNAITIRMIREKVRIII